MTQAERAAELQRLWEHRLREISGDEAKRVRKFCNRYGMEVADDAPVGANDSFYVYATVVGRELVLVDQGQVFA